MRMKQHTAKEFDEDIQNMRMSVLAMAELVERQFSSAIEAMRYRDLRLAAEILEKEDLVNRMQVKTDLLCSQILVVRQPTAVDLREVLSAMQIVNELERIGDESKKIAVRSRNLGPIEADRTMPLQRVGEMGEAAGAMLGRMIRALRHYDVALARDIHASDREIDQQRDALIEAMRVRMSEQRELVTVALDLVFIIQSIERVGDHVKNIAEYMLHVAQGIDVRHSRLSGEGSA
jgi:phosphate transport system protein